MSEPTLEAIGDYNTLKGSKKRVVWGVIIVGLLIGIAYVVAYNSYAEVDDSIKVESSIKKIPYK